MNYFRVVFVLGVTAMIYGIFVCFWYGRKQYKAQHHLRPRRSQVRIYCADFEAKKSTDLTCMFSCCHPVADPGFPGGGANPCLWAKNLLFDKKFTKNCMKVKEI